MIDIGTMTRPELVHPMVQVQDLTMDLTKIPNFNGEDNEDQITPKLWYRKMRDEAKKQNWTDKQAAGIAAEKLTGGALEWLQSLNAAEYQDINSWKSISEAFMKKYTQGTPNKMEEAVPITSQKERVSQAVPITSQKERVRHITATR